MSVAHPLPGKPVTYAEHESIYFRDTIVYSAGSLGIHRLGYFLGHQCRRVERHLHPDRRAVLVARLAVLVGLVSQHSRLGPERVPLTWRGITRCSPRSRWLDRFEPGTPLPCGRQLAGRVLTPRQSVWLGRIGEGAGRADAHLGVIGLLSIACGFIAIEIIGLNMWASVDWNLIRFIKMLPFLSLEPPSAKQGLSLFPPLDDGGWWLMAGFFLTSPRSCCGGSACTAGPTAIGLSTHIPWAFASAIWLYLVLGFFRPILMGSPGRRRCRLASSPTSTGPPPSPSATETCSTTRSTCFQHRVPVRVHDVVRHAWRHDPGHRMQYGGERETREIIDPGSAIRARRAVLALDNGIQRQFRLDPPLDLLVRDPHHADWRHRHPDDRHRGG